VRPKDTVITLGAGNVYKMGEAFLKKMVAREKSK